MISGKRRLIPSIASASLQNASYAPPSPISASISFHRSITSSPDRKTKNGNYSGPTTLTQCDPYAENRFRNPVNLPGMPEVTSRPGAYNAPQDKKAETASQAKKRLGIGSPMEMKGNLVKRKIGSGGSSLIAKYSKKHIIKPSDLMYFSETELPLSWAILKQYEKKLETEPLWIHIQTILFPKPVVRNHAKRRVREALRMALKDEGYGLHGEHLAGEQGKSSGSSLNGTLWLVIRDPAELCNSPSATVKEAAQVTVKALLDAASSTNRAAATPYPRRNRDMGGSKRASGRAGDYGSNHAMNTSRRGSDGGW